MPAIELDSATKRYGDVTALSDLDLQVHEGEVYGFLGPNGAGKSTTINLLLDFIRPTTGSVKVFGHDAQQESITIRQRTGVLPEGFDLYDRLTGRQHLQFVNESKNASDDPKRIVERVGIPDAIDRKVGGYSKGMVQRLGLGAALVGEPDLLILDEPSTGVDRVPEGALSAVRGLSGISETSVDGTTVTVRCRDDTKTAVLNELEAAGASIRDFDLEEPSLEELFMTYTSDETETGDVTAEYTEGQQ